MTRMMKKNLPGSASSHTSSTFELQLRTLELRSSVPALTFELSDHLIQIIDTHYCIFSPFYSNNTDDFILNPCGAKEL